MYESTEDPGVSRNDGMECPVCSTSFPSLVKLNQHLDVDHEFDNAIESTINKSFSKSVNLKENASMKERKTQKKVNTINKTYWRRPEPMQMTCQECGRPFEKSSIPINCRKCGELFCKRHCRNVICLNINAEYDPINGIWANCCHKCFKSRPGYEDYGYSFDHTDEFQLLRQKKIEDKKLRQLQLENRLIRLVDGIAKVIKKNKNDILMNYRNFKEISRLERTIVSWKNDQNVHNCFICLQSFSFTLRKHHCRICGEVVCDESSSNCSNQIPIPYLANAANDLPFREYRQDLFSNEYAIRICSKCIHVLYTERKFNRDLQQQPPILLQQCESIYNASQVISNIWPLLDVALQRIEKDKKEGIISDPSFITESMKLRKRFIRVLDAYNVSTKRLASILPKNNTEKQIQQSQQTASSLFITEKLLKLKSFAYVTSKVDPVAKETTPEFHSLSDITFNNLSIKEIKKYREELMVLKEQTFLVDTMIENAKKQRKFDELTVLGENMSELTERIQKIKLKLGDEGFT